MQGGFIWWGGYYQAPPAFPGGSRSVHHPVHTTSSRQSERVRASLNGFAPAWTSGYQLGRVCTSLDEWVPVSTSAKSGPPWGRRAGGIAAGVEPRRLPILRTALAQVKRTEEAAPLRRAAYLRRRNRNKEQWLPVWYDTPRPNARGRGEKVLPVYRAMRTRSNTARTRYTATGPPRRGRYRRCTHSRILHTRCTATGPPRRGRSHRPGLGVLCTCPNATIPAQPGQGAFCRIGDLAQCGRGVSSKVLPVSCPSSRLL